MIKFTSLSQKFLFGYILAIASLILHFIIIGQAKNLTMLATTIGSIVVISTIFFILHLYLYRNFIKPIHHLIQVTKDHTANTHSKLRARKISDDELGDLVDTFNEMINQIQLREEIIISERDRVAIALEQADNYAEVTQSTNKKLELEVQVRKGIEAELTEVQQFLNSVINSNPSALIAIDENLTIKLWNFAASQLGGIEAKQASGKNLNEALPILNDHIDWIRKVWDANATRLIRKAEVHLNDRTRSLELIVYPLRNTRQLAAVIRIDDVTEKIKMEEAIVQSEKIMSLGGMAAGMAHEINNPISAIVQNVQNIQRRIRTDLEANQELAREIGIHLDQLNAYLDQRKITGFLKNISDSGLRASQLVANMLQFSRANDLSLQPCRVVEVLEKAISIASTNDLMHDFKDTISLNFDQNFKDPDAYVRGVFTELEQVILNLIKNSTHAIHQRKLTLNDIDEGVIRIHQFTRDDRCFIQVTDNGIGMSAETRRHVFEPFFTTKDVGAGTGLGMSVSYFIVTSHHKGTMHVDSELGHGATFEIALPLLKD
ncbi:HAMP domain-containing sensor histidine kinase [Reinekea marinisedimentorum]|uniref:histidine kinase n=1 Tax=Reinekea marinisedimentorum TaxID=230495 RepID=A0A4R3I7F1_9GAMM|nr:HAMP domain-containing sensor histidine kinase [Reinekea marinisedimentorum]TCS42085.1 PAS domain S-box-containing protein [Reinekea marinisedimentorum]